MLPVSEKYADYAQEVFKELRRNGVDVTVDNSAERLGYKLRQAQLDRLPYMLVVGGKEEEEKTVSVRSRFAGDEGSKPLSAFVDQICEEIRTKAIRKEEPKDEEILEFSAEEPSSEKTEDTEEILEFIPDEEEGGIEK